MDSAASSTTPPAPRVPRAPASFTGVQAFPVDSTANAWLFIAAVARVAEQRRAEIERALPADAMDVYDNTVARAIDFLRARALIPIMPLPEPLARSIAELEYARMHPPPPVRTLRVALEASARGTACWLRQFDGELLSHTMVLGVPPPSPEEEEHNRKTVVVVPPPHGDGLTGPTITERRNAAVLLSTNDMQLALSGGVVDEEDDPRELRGRGMAIRAVCVAVMLQLAPMALQLARVLGEGSLGAENRQFLEDCTPVHCAGTPLPELVRACTLVCFVCFTLRHRAVQAAQAARVHARAM